MSACNRRIKVLRIIGEYTAGGVEKIAINYYRNINHAEIGLDLMFLGSKLPDISDEMSANGDSLFGATEYRNNVFKCINDIRTVVKENGYDVVHAQLNTLNVIALFGAYLGGAKVRISSNHSTANLKYEFKKSLLKYLLRPTTTWFATNLAACSEYAGRWCFGNRKFDAGKVTIIRNAIDLDEFTFCEGTRSEVRKSYGWEDKFVIGHAGRFVQQKNHVFLLQIFAEIHKKNDRAILVLAGDGPLVDTVKRQSEVLGIRDSVFFLGVRKDMSKLMQAMDVFMLPSLYEGFGNVITEAQAVGLHSVVSENVPYEVCQSNLVDFVSLNKDPATWADTVLKYSIGYGRENPREELATAGFDIKTAAKSLEKYYKDLSVND